MEAFWGGLLTVGLAELGDKTQLLAFMLVRQLRRPLIVGLALALAFLFSYAIAGAFGAWMQQSLLLDWIRLLAGLMFMGIGCWIVYAGDEQTDEIQMRPASAWSAFMLAFVTVFIGELGDKSQFTVLAVSIAFEPFWLIVAGALIGSLIVNLPVIWLGQQSHSSPWMNDRLQQWFRWLAGGVFIVFGLVLLVSQLV